MVLVGFAFTKLDATRVNNPKGKITINHDIKVEDVKHAQIKGGEASGGLLIEFSYTVSYKPSVGKLRLEGNFVETHENAKEIADTYAKDKEMPAELKERLYNLINRKSLVKAIYLSEQVGLPSPINMPTLKFSDKKEK